MNSSFHIPVILKRLADHFVPPLVPGLDIGSSVVKLVEIAPSEKGMVLRRAAIRRVQDGDLTSSIKQLLSESGVTTRRVVVGLASPEVIARPFQFPRMSTKELSSAIHLEAEHAILNGHSIKEVMVDWHVLSDHSTDGIRGLLAVAPKTTLAERMTIIRAAGLRPWMMDVEGLALWNAYWALLGSHEPSQKTIFLIHVGAQTTNLVIAKGRDELILMRDLQIGGQSIVNDQGNEWSAEVQDSLAYARSKNGLRTLDFVYVTGGGTSPRLTHLLKPIVRVPVTFWNPLDQLERDPKCPPLEDSAGPLLTLAIGLALRRTS